MAGTCGYGEVLSGSINAGNFLTSCKVYWLASQEGLCSREYDSEKGKCHFSHNNGRNKDIFYEL